MATDATGTPTSPDSIPKFNTAVDKPSGKGFNAAMDAIQTALNTKIGSASDTPASGEVPVWNGSDWVYQGLTSSQVSGLLPVTKLATGSDGQYLKTTGGATAWATGPSHTVARWGGTVEANNTTTETTLVSTTVPGGLMSANSHAKLTMFGGVYDNFTGTAATIRAKYGPSPTTLISDALTDMTNSANVRPWRAEYNIVNSNSTSSNMQWFTLQVGSTIAATPGVGDMGTLQSLGGGWNGTLTTLNTAASFAMIVTVQWSVANAAAIWRIHHYTVEVY